MKSYEELRNNYEEALFALLMNRIAEAEGEQALSYAKALNEDPEAAVPPELEARCIDVVNGAIKKNNIVSFRKTAAKICSRAAVWLLVLIGLCSVTIVSSEAVRNSVFNYVYNEFGYTIKIGITKKELPNEFAKDPTAFHAGWVPEGFVLHEKENNSWLSWEQYMHDEDSTKMLDITIIYDEDPSLDIDTEFASVSKIEIDGFEAVVSEKDATTLVVWSDTDRGIVCEVSGDFVPKDMVIRFAENIIFD